MRLGKTILLCLLNFSVAAQTDLSYVRQSTLTFSDTNLVNQTNTPLKNRRMFWATALQTAGYGGTLLALSQTWYSQYPRSRWKAFNDWHEWKQIDKFGHVYGTYIQGKTSMELWRWAGASRKTQVWLGGLTGTAFQTIIEYMDGRSADWGWSWGDMGANIAGSAWLIGQELAWKEQRIHLKFSFHSARYADPEIQQRSMDLYGEKWTTRMLKDYNAQTYWASVRIKSFWKKAPVPDWLCISLGTGADGLWGASSNLKLDASGNTVFDRRDIPRQRQWYLSPDIDFTKIHTRKKWVKVALYTLNAFKCPMPTLEFQAGKWKLRPLYF